MHVSTYNKMQDIRSKHVMPNFRILDINGLNFKDVFSDCQYHTLNPNQTQNSDELWSVVGDQTEDVVISCLHLHREPMFWKTLHNMACLCKAGGRIVIIVPDVFEKPACYYFDESVFFQFSKYMDCALVEVCRTHDAQVVHFRKEK